MLFVAMRKGIGPEGLSYAKPFQCRGLRSPLPRYRFVVGSGFSRDALRHHDPSLHREKTSRLKALLQKRGWMPRSSITVPASPLRCWPEGLSYTTPDQRRGLRSPFPRHRFVVGSGFSRDALRHHDPSLHHEKTSRLKALLQRRGRMPRASITVSASPLRCRKRLQPRCSFSQTAQRHRS
jgi:hypothetical protein